MPVRVRHQLLEHIAGGPQFTAPQEHGRGIETGETYIYRLSRRLGLADCLPRDLQCPIRKAAQPQYPLVYDERAKSIIECKQLRIEMSRAREPSLQMPPRDRVTAQEMV